jgi:hypothetical protein
MEFEDVQKLNLDGNAHINHALATMVELVDLVDYVDACESTKRLYIDPLLIAAGLVAERLKLNVEESVSSPEANGPVDYMF